MATTRKTKFLRTAPARSRKSCQSASLVIKADIDRIMAKVEHWDDERNIGNGIIVTLKPNIFFYDDCSVMVFDNEKDARTEISKAKEL